MGIIPERKLTRKRWAIIAIKITEGLGLLFKIH